MGTNHEVNSPKTRQMLKASRGEPEKYKLRYIDVKAACV